MAEPQTRDNNLAQKPSLSSSHSLTSYAADPDPGSHPPVPPPAVFDDVANEDPDLTREPKRRRLCPTALENLDELTSASNSSFTFTFDTKFCGFSPEVTPKFGSFNSIIPQIEENQKKKKKMIEQSSLLNSASEVRGEEEEKGESIQQIEEDAIGGGGGALKIMTGLGMICMLG